jgi:BCD family chlorophyll transporter-like MFS transporter
VSTEARPLPKAAGLWRKVGPRWLPFADLATDDVPLGRLVRLSMFQWSVGIAQTLFFGTLNRVMIVELGIPATIIALMIAIPLLVAPFRALIGFRSDTYRSFLGWRRVPFVYFGTLAQFAGLAIMPFALMLLSGDQTVGHPAIGYIGSGVAFFLVGAGAHTVQTAGLALATDLAPEDKRPRVVALMYLQMLMGVVLSGVILGLILEEFNPIKLVQVIQGCAVFCVFMNSYALWKQEPRRRGIAPYAKGERRPLFRDAWRAFAAGGVAVRLLVVVAIGSFAFNLQDVLLEPFGGEVLHLNVGGTTLLNAVYASGVVLAFVLASTMLSMRMTQVVVCAWGAVVGLLGFGLVLLAGNVANGAGLFRGGAFYIGLGEGLFCIGTLHLAMSLKDAEQHGIALGAWGAVFATAEGLALTLSGFMRDGVKVLGARGELPSWLVGTAAGYEVVYTMEIVLLVLTLLSLRALVGVGRGSVHTEQSQQPFGLADVPA